MASRKPLNRAAVLAALCLLALLGGCSAGGPGAATPTPEAAPSPSVGWATGMNPTLSLEDARGIALADAKVSAADAVFTEGELEDENGIWVYELKFHTSAARYEYEVNANTGAIRKMRAEHYAAPAAAAAPTPAPTPTPAPVSSTSPAYTHHPESGHHSEPPHHSGGTQYITMEQAKSAALAHAGLSADQVAFTRQSTDWEDGVMVYELEFQTGTMEYEYEIHAVTGAVLKCGSESVHHPEPSHHGGGTQYITVDQAKSAALAHAGLSADQVFFTKAVMGWDSGTAVYEIEFQVGTVEYEYEIHAVTGAVLEYEIDRD